MRKQRSAGEWVFDIINTVFMTVIVIACLYPFYYMLMYAFSDPVKAETGISLFPRGFTFFNFAQVLKMSNFTNAAWISLSRTLIGTLITLLCCTFFAYLVSKPEMVLRKTFYRLLVVTMYVNGGLIPTYLVYNAYGLSNSFLIYILPGALTAYNVILIKTFVEQLPASLEESAMLDGAGYMRCWWSIVLPLSKPIIATIAVFAVVGQWNAWFDAHLYVTKREMWPLQYVLYRLLLQVQEMARMAQEFGQDSGGVQITPTAVRMTITAIVTIPVLLIYPFMQRFFTKGILLGAVKG